MSRLVSIPGYILAERNSAAVIAATRAALQSGFIPIGKVSVSGPRSTILVPDDIYAAIDTGRGSVTRYIIEASMRSDTIERITPRLPAPRITKQQAKVQDDRLLRLRIASEDAEDGKWARVYLTSGSATVDQFRDGGDYDDEITGGLVVRTTVPLGLNAEEAYAWILSKTVRHGGPTRMHWHYLDADSETLMDARDAEMRAKVRANGGEAADLVAQIEREEELQIQEYGRKSAYIALAREDLKLLGKSAGENILRITLDSRKIIR